MVIIRSPNNLLLRSLIKQSADFLSQSNELDAWYKVCDESAKAARNAGIGAQEQVNALTAENNRLKFANNRQAARFEAASAETARLYSVYELPGVQSLLLVCPYLAGFVTGDMVRGNGGLTPMSDAVV